MTSRIPSWMIAGVILVAAAIGLGWWAYQATTPAVLSTPPVTSSGTSPLASPLIDTLRQRTTYGNVPVADQSPYTRTDPFTKP